MALIDKRPLVYFSDPGLAISDIDQENSVISSAWDEYDEQLDVDLNEQLAQCWFPRASTSTNNTDLRTRNSCSYQSQRPRKSSLKDTSRMKFPNTPKTKKLRWREDEFLVSYQTSEEDDVQKADKLLGLLLREIPSPTPSSEHNTVQSLISDIKPYCSKVLASSKLRPISSSSAPLLPQCQSYIADPWSQSEHPGGSHELIANNQTSNGTNGGGGEDCNFIRTYFINQSGWVLGIVGFLCTKLMRGLKAIPTKLIRTDWYRVMSGLLYEYEEELGLLTDSMMDSLNPDEYERVNTSIDANLNNIHVLNSSRPPRWQSWNHITTLQSSIINFDCHIINKPSPQDELFDSWVFQFCNQQRALFSSTRQRGENHDIRCRRPGLHSRSTAEILQIQKFYSGMLHRENWKTKWMNRTTRGRWIVYLVGSGAGLPIIFEEEKESENNSAKMECWRCDSCEECLGMALEEVHSSWKREMSEHTCCPCGQF